jgi:hypothetical protein
MTAELIPEPAPVKVIFWKTAEPEFCAKAPVAARRLMLANATDRAICRYVVIVFLCLAGVLVGHSPQGRSDVKCKIGDKEIKS